MKERNRWFSVVPMQKPINLVRFWAETRHVAKQSGSLVIAKYLSQLSCVYIFEIKYLPVTNYSETFGTRCVRYQIRLMQPNDGWWGSMKKLHCLTLSIKTAKISMPESRDVDYLHGRWLRLVFKGCEDSQISEINVKKVWEEFPWGEPGYPFEALILTLH